jgi:hypothetical protein
VAGFLLGFRLFEVKTETATGNLGPLATVSATRRYVMVNRSFLLSAFGAAVFCVTAVASSSAWGTERRTDYLTFNGPVGLPGVGLARGTYIFELADPGGDLSIVRVSS